MELFIRNEMRVKKTRIFNQQKHYTKRSMYNDEVNGIGKDEVSSREVVRNERLGRIDIQKITPYNALIPRLKTMATNINEETYLRKTFNLIKPDPDLGDIKRVKRLVPRIAVSDMEEVKERQRYLKYDLIWARAESAFIKKKRQLAGKETEDD